MERGKEEVIRDLNNTRYANCLEWLRIGLEILDDPNIIRDEKHRFSRDAVSQYLTEHQKTDPTAGVCSSWMWSLFKDPS